MLGVHGPVESGEGNIGADTQALLTFGTVGVNLVDDPAHSTLFEQGFAQSKVKDFGVFWGWSAAFDGVESDYRG
jgi:hypothetical protein